jgi:lipoprotein signal peptidase
VQSKWVQRARVVLIIFLFFVDLVLKHWAVRGNYAAINQGISLGIEMWTEWIFWICISFLFVWLIRQKLWLILAGGSANVVSRLVWGGVVDYWNFLGLFANNLADWMIVGGALIYGLDHMRQHHLYINKPIH